jgi:hypothetical protein
MVWARRTLLHQRIFVIFSVRFQDPGGRLSPEALKEIIEIGREALRIEEPLAAKRIFDFSLAAEAMK